MKLISFLTLLSVSAICYGAEMIYPNDENGTVLQAMHDDGVALNREYEVDFVHSFKTEKSAQLMASEISSSYTDVKVSISVYDGGIDVYVKKNLIPTHEAITRNETLFGRIAKKHGGHSDGWGFES
jgi:hypothetical protein